MNLESDVAITVERANALLEEVREAVCEAVRRYLPILKQRGLDAEDYVHNVLPAVRKALLAGRIENLKFYWTSSAINSFRRSAVKEQRECPWDHVADRVVRDERPASMLLMELLGDIPDLDYRLAEDRFINGYTLQQVADKHNVSVDFVRYRLDKIRSQKDHTQ